MWVRVAQRYEIEGWGVSLVLHLILLSVIWPTLQQLPAPVLTEPFRWNVTLVQSSQPSAAVESSSGKPSLLNQDVGAVDAAAQNPKPARPARPSLDRSLHNASPMTVQPVAANRSTTTTVPLEPGDSSPKVPDVVPPTPPLTDSMPVSQERPSAPHEMVEQTQELVATAPLQGEPTGLIAVPREVEAPPQFPGPRADYSWLQRAVSRRLEELKQFSRPSLGQSTKVKVLVKAVVSNSGELMETEVVKSSGLARIDQEAVALVQRAFPVSLDEVIDRPQIVMRIPITYSRD